MKSTELFPTQPQYGSKINADFDTLSIEAYDDEMLESIEIRPSDLKNFNNVTLLIKTVQRVFHPELKYQYESDYLETKAVFTKKKNFWGKVKWVPDSHYLVSEKSLNKISRELEVWTD